MSIGNESKDRDGIFTALFKSIKRAYTKEIPNLTIECNIDGHLHQLKTDKEGYFQLFEKVAKHDHNNEIAIISCKIKGKQVQHSITLTNYKFDMPVGIISDIDDTILVTRVKSFFKLRMLINTIFINPFRRKSVNNAAKYYKSKLENEEGTGPIIYVSNSPWNMYAYLRSFLHHNQFPEGELQLRDFGLQMQRKKKPLELQNKYLEVEKTLKIFGKTKFILVGDSAEKDYDIYTKLK